MHKILQSLTLSLLVVGCLFLFHSCAKQGYPSGGPKDTTPPVVKGVNPASESLNFSSNKFKIDFDEYVTVKDADNNVLISPPMRSKPEYSTKGHSLIVKIKDTLLPNTTSLFQFKGAIVDFNEGNPLPSFEYVFSTGDAIDSMALSGKVLDALSLQPFASPVSLFAYLISDSTTLSDSLVSKSVPTYQTRTSASGDFAFNYMAPGNYMLVAIDDADKNMRYSSPEAFAWLDTIVHPHLMPHSPSADSAAHDSLSLHASVDSSALPSLTLYISAQETSVQRVTNSSFIGKGEAQIITQSPMQNPSLQCDSIVWTLLPHRDTLRLWTLRQSCDSLTIVITDSATSLLDTLTLKYREPKKSKRNSSFQPLDLCKIQSLVGSSHPYFDTIKVQFSTPIRQASLDSIPLLLLADSSLSYAKALLDTSRTSALIIPSSPLRQGESYKVHIPRNACYDIYNRPNDSLSFVTTLTKEEDYGTITIDFTASIAQLQSPILQLLNDKGDIVLQQAVTSHSVTFNHLKPSSYKLRLFDDTDQNLQWTPGSYYDHRQPEQVIYFPKTLQLRANWEMAETWQLQP